MFCPSCRSEYRPGIATCAHCNTALVAELPPEDAFASRETMAKNLAEKEVVPLVLGALASLEEAQDFLRGERLATVVAPADDDDQEAGMHARYQLMVAPDDLDRARGMLEKRWQSGIEREGLLLGDSPAEGSCPACGSAVPETAKECPDCGLFLGEA